MIDGNPDLAWLGEEFKAGRITKEQYDEHVREHLAYYESGDEYGMRVLKKSPAEDDDE